MVEKCSDYCTAMKFYLFLSFEGLSNIEEISVRWNPIETIAGKWTICREDTYKYAHTEKL